MIRTTDQEHFGILYSILTFIDINVNFFIPKQYLLTVGKFDVKVLCIFLSLVRILTTTVLFLNRL